MAEPRFISRQFRIEDDERFQGNRFWFPTGVREFHKFCNLVQSSGLDCRSTKLEGQLKLNVKDCVWCATSSNLCLWAMPDIGKVAINMPFLSRFHVSLQTADCDPEGLSTSSASNPIGFYKSRKDRDCSFENFIMCNTFWTVTFWCTYVGYKHSYEAKISWMGEDVDAPGSFVQLVTLTLKNGLEIYAKATKQCGKKIVRPDSSEEHDAYFYPLTIYRD